MIEGLRASEALAGLSLEEISTFSLMTNRDGWQSVT